ANDYITQIGNYAVGEKYYGQGTFSFSGDLKMSKKNGVWKTDTITVGGDSREILTFDNIPANIKIMDADFDTEIPNQFFVGDRFYLSYVGADPENDLKDFELTYKTKEISVDFYKWNPGTGDVAPKDYQNLINLVSKEKENELKIAVEKDSNSSNNPGNNGGNSTVVVPQMDITVNINKYKKGTTERVIGAELALYEGDSDQGNLVEKWTSTDQVKEIKVEAGKTYTLVELSAPEGYKLADPITFKAEKNSIVTDTSVSTAKDDTDYVGFRDGMKYITDGNNKWPVYCLNHSLTNPDYSSQIPDLSNNNYPHYRHWSLGNVSDDILFNNQTEKFTKEQLANLLLAGYPTDTFGYQKKYGLSDDQAYNMIQTLLDEVLAGRTDAKDLSKISDETYKKLYGYYNDVLAVYLNPQIENASSKVDLFSWVQGTGSVKDKDYQTLAGITPIGNDATMVVIMEDDVAPVVQKGTLEVVKRDKEDQSLLEGAEFGVYDEKDQLVAQGKTNDKGFFTVELDLGKYYVKELKAPDKYILDDTKHSFEIVNGKQFIQIEVFNKKDTNDNSNGNTSGGSNTGNNGGSDGSTTEDNNTGNDGGSNGNTSEGSNTENNSGSNGSTSEGTNSGNNNLNNNNSNNTTNREEGILRIVKKDSKKGTLLSGAKFGIYNEREERVAVGVTNENGVLTISLEKGRYYLKELKAPNGYLLNSTKYPFEISKNGEQIEVEVLNEKVEVNDSEAIIDEEDNNKTAIDSYTNTKEDSMKEKEISSTQKKEEKESSKVVEKNRGVKVPKTGDYNTMGLYFFGMLLSGFCILVLQKKKICSK
ncbi:MAG: LPXTG cell wall anchor domain-containing protein, partial [Clostridiales bacterium]|nr:LPXTG cell wall anchor domain-containing protein [Clostridiales bacterium]